MIKKTITYTDYNGEKKTETFLFNLSRAELIRMEFDYGGSLESYINRITYEKDYKKLYAIFEELIALSYGEKSFDGKKFIKSKELTEDFKFSEAYSELIVTLLSNADEAAAWVNGLIEPAKADTRPDAVVLPASE